MCEGSPVRPWPDLERHARCSGPGKRGARRGAFPRPSDRPSAAWGHSTGCLESSRLQLPRSERRCRYHRPHEVRTPVRLHRPDRRHSHRGRARPGTGPRPGSRPHAAGAGQSVRPELRARHLRLGARASGLERRGGPGVFFDPQRTIPARCRPMHWAARASASSTRVDRAFWPGD